MINESMLNDYKSFFNKLTVLNNDTLDTLDRIHLFVNTLDFLTAISKDIDESDTEEALILLNDVKEFYKNLVSSVDKEVVDGVLSNIFYYQNVLRWVLYDSVNFNSMNIGSTSVSEIMQCSRSKVNQYIRTARTFDPSMRDYFIPVIVFDTAGDVKNSPLSPTELVSEAIDNGLTAKEVKAKIDQSREIPHKKLKAAGSGILKWEGNNIFIEPTRVDYDNSTVGEDMTDVEVLWNITQR